MLLPHPPTTSIMSSYGRPSLVIVVIVIVVATAVVFVVIVIITGNETMECTQLLL